MYISLMPLELGDTTKGRCANRTNVLFLFLMLSMSFCVEE